MKIMKPRPLVAPDDKPCRVPPKRDQRSRLHVLSVRTTMTAALAALAFLTGCGRATIEPPTIDPGQTPCAECGMAVSEVRYAAGLVVSGTEEGQAALAFDDIGCMLHYEKAHPDRAVLARYVVDLDTSQWIEASIAWFARSEAIHSPMASGLAACRTRARARQLLAGQPGDVLSWTDLATSRGPDRH